MRQSRMPPYAFWHVLVSVLLLIFPASNADAQVGLTQLEPVS